MKGGENYMTKTDLIKKLSEVTVNKQQAKDVLDKFTETITQALKDEESVQITGFGTFDISHRKARKGRNPRTGEPLQIPAMNIPKFKAGKNLKEAVR